MIDEDHSARSIWQLVARLDLSLYHAEIAVLKGALAATMQRAVVNQLVAVCLQPRDFDRHVSWGLENQGGPT